MNKLLKILLLLLSLFLLITPVSAESFPKEEAEDFFKNSEWQEIEELVPEEAGKLAEEQGIETITDWSSLSLSGLWDTLRCRLRGLINRPLKVLSSLVGVILVSVLLKSVSGSFCESTLSPVFGVIASVFCVGLLMGPLTESLDGVTAVIHQFTDFLAAYIPAFAGIVTTAGQPMTAAAYNVLLFGACQVVGQVLQNYFLPFVSCYLSLAIVSELVPQMGLSRLVGGVKTFITWALGFLMTLFFGLLTIRTVVASAGDSVAVKTTKFFISSFIPVVGGSLSDLFVATHGCMQFLKGTVGVFGIAAALCTFLPIVLKTALWYLTVRLGSLISGVFGEEILDRLLKSIASAYGIVLAVLLYYALLFIISTTLLIVAFKGG